MGFDKIVTFKKLVIFSLEQLTVYLEAKKEDYEANSVHKTTHHSVYKENMAILEDEVLYITRTVDFVEAIDVSKYDSVENYKESLLIKVKDHYHERGVPMACYVIFSEKIANCYEFYKNLFGG